MGEIKMQEEIVEEIGIPTKLESALGDLKVLDKISEGSEADEWAKEIFAKEKELEELRAKNAFYVRNQKLAFYLLVCFGIALILKLLF
jgi:hypothetical protein